MTTKGYTKTFFGFCTILYNINYLRIYKNSAKDDIFKKNNLLN